MVAHGHRQVHLTQPGAKRAAPGKVPPFICPRGTQAEPRGKPGRPPTEDLVPVRRPGPRTSRVQPGHPDPPAPRPTRSAGAAGATPHTSRSFRHQRPRLRSGRPFLPRAPALPLADEASYLPVGPGVAPPVSGVDLVPTETAEFNPVTKSENPSGRVSTARRSHS